MITYKIGLIFLISFFTGIQCELIQHSWQSNDIEHGMDILHEDHRTHIAHNPHHSDSSSKEHEHETYEFIEVPDFVTEIALKAKTYEDAEQFAKKFGFKNLGRVSNLLNIFF